MTSLNILLGVVAAVLLIGVIGEQDKNKSMHITIAFVAVVLLIMCANTIM